MTWQDATTGVVSSGELMMEIGVTAANVPDDWLDYDDCTAAAATEARREDRRASAVLPPQRAPRPPQQTRPRPMPQARRIVDQGRLQRRWAREMMP